MTGKRVFSGLLAMFYSLLGVAASQLPDSLLTFDKAYYYNIVDMPKSLQIVQTMRKRKMAAEWECDRAEANLWSLARYYNKAIGLYCKVIDNPEANKSWRDELTNLFLVSYCYEKLNDERHLFKLVLRMRELAEKHQAKEYLCMAEYIRGKRFYAMGRKDESYVIFKQAAEDMKHVGYRYKNRMLFVFNINIANMYINEGKYGDAKKSLREAEEAIRQGFNMGVLDVERRAFGLVCAVKARLLAAEGHVEEADSMYALMRGAPYRDIAAEMMIVPYLKMRGRYADILESAQYSRKIIEEDSNELGINMLRVLKDEVDAHIGLNNYEAAAQCYSTLTRLTDSLHVNNMNYFSKEAREDLQREHVIARQNLQLSIGISVLIILVLLMLAAFLHHLQTRKRTKMMMATIDELMYYRDIVLQNGDRVSVEMGENDAVLHEEKRRFKEMDKRIIKEELFRSPDFGRDDLMRLMGVDKNAIAPIVQKYAHTNVSGYVKMKRMEYAVALLKEHPELTIAAIADMSGIKSATTFVNHFKETYGMAPSDYRASIVDSTPPNR
jgi:AraC-like DNA-binding protein